MSELQNKCQGYLGYQGFDVYDPKFTIFMNSKFRFRSVMYFTGNSQINSNF